MRLGLNYRIHVKTGKIAIKPLLGADSILITVVNGKKIGTENRVKDLKTAFKPTSREGFSA
jgi:hypothetical protein